MPVAESGGFEPTPVTYRGYVFVNTALSSIQKGVQGAHALAELVRFYLMQPDDCLEREVTSDWARFHKTLIFLDGGFHSTLKENYAQFRTLCEQLKLPSMGFYEDEETLNTAFTAFAGVIPSTVFDISEELMLKYHQEGVYVKLLKQTGGWTEADKLLEAKCQLNRFIRQFRLAI